MGISIKYGRSVLVLFMFISTISILVRCVNQQHEQKPVARTADAPPGFAEFVNAETCAGCHQSIYESHKRTAHHLTALPADEKNILGSFKKGKNTYSYTPLIML